MEQAHARRRREGEGREQILRTQPARDGWRFGEEEGHIDGRRLAQLISAPCGVIHEPWPW